MRFLIFNCRPKASIGIERVPINQRYHIDWILKEKTISTMITLLRLIRQFFCYVIQLQQTIAICREMLMIHSSCIWFPSEPIIVDSKPHYKLKSL